MTPLSQSWAFVARRRHRCRCRAVAQQNEGAAAVDVLAVGPSAQRAGLGAALTAHAVEWMRDHRITLAIVETGGDPGHAPARRTYEAVGFTKMPIARYFRVLE